MQDMHFVHNDGIMTSEKNLHVDALKVLAAVGVAAACLHCSVGNDKHIWCVSHDNRSKNGAMV